MRTEPPKLRTAYETIDSGSATGALLQHISGADQALRALGHLLNIAALLLLVAIPALTWVLYHWAFTQ